MFDVSQTPENTLIKVSTQRFDAATATEFRDYLAKIDLTKAPTATIDLSEVEFIDSSGIGALLGVHKKLPPNSPPVQLTGLRPALSKVFTLLRLDKVFQLVNQ